MAAYNQTTDVNSPPVNYEKLNLAGRSENDAIEKLFKAKDAYKNNALYALIPASSPGRYNSNSFVAGLLDVTGISRPIFLDNYRELYPGQETPLPRSFFPGF
jgi:hypothetical protein